ALPVFRIERLANVISTRSASSVSVMRLSCSMSSSFTMIGMSDHSFEIFSHERAFREHAGQHEHEDYSEPSIDGEAGMHIHAMRRSRNDFGDCADDQAQEL